MAKGALHYIKGAGGVHEFFSEIDFLLFLEGIYIFQMLFFSLFQILIPLTLLGFPVE